MMNRREFLAAAAGATGHSVFVRADTTSAPPAVAPAAPEIRAVFERISPAAAHSGALGEPHMELVELSCDVMVAGGGLAGVCAAISAARHGAKVVLVQDR